MYFSKLEFILATERSCCSRVSNHRVWLPAHPSRLRVPLAAAHRKRNGLPGLPVNPEIRPSNPTTKIRQSRRKVFCYHSSRTPYPHGNLSIQICWGVMQKGLRSPHRTSLLASRTIKISEILSKEMCSSRQPVWKVHNRLEGGPHNSKVASTQFVRKKLLGESPPWRPTRICKQSPGILRVE